jgi:hypothetical protein
MWLTRDYHVTPRYSQLLLRVRAVDALPCQNMRCHDNHMTCCILCPPFGGGVWGTRLNRATKATASHVTVAKVIVAAHGNLVNFVTRS